MSGLPSGPRPRLDAKALLLPAALVLAATIPGLARTPELLKAVGGIPAHLAGMFEEPIAYHRLPGGRSYVFDRRAHAIYAIDAGADTATRLVTVGPESGHLLGPTAFDSSSDGVFVVADAPNMVERIQFFNDKGEKIGGFLIGGHNKAAARVTIGTLVVSGVGSLQFAGRSILINRPETGGLITEYGLGGTPLRTIGNLRSTGQEADRDVHLALNVGLPLANPKGGFYFVFQTGEPRFRKYDRQGNLEIDRLMQGRELDGLVKSLPTSWPRRSIGGETLPLVPPTVRAAAVDPDGQLWVSFMVPYTYVFDGDGDLVRTVQFQGAGIVSPTSLCFPDRGHVLVTPGLYEFATR